MRRVFIIVIISGIMLLLQSMSYASSIPAEVMKPYKAFNTAYQSKDFKTALGHGKKAWLEAEKLLGDHKTTGDLAYNYGRLAMRLGDNKSAVKPLMRSADLAVLAKDNGAMIRLEREVELAAAMLGSDQKNKAWKRLDKAREFAGANALDDGIFAAELRVHQARILATNANWQAKYSGHALASSTKINSKVKDRAGRTQSKSGQYAQTAIDIFDKYPGLYREDYAAIAYKLIGFSYERDKQWLEAALAYQKAIEILRKYLEFEDPQLITTIGRWSNSRTHLLARMGQEEALEKGLCKCWPYESEIKRITHPVKRVPPKMPRKAYTSGFSFVKFDLDDAGNTKNIRILHSWPKDIYDKPSLRSVQKWKYEPRTEVETDEQRKDFITSVRYILTDYYGNDPI
ncbi:MAG: TonB family protein [Robiginitomaculum sp.]|nr:TonB family protein [Robiginitomaculum sp.]